MKSHFRARWSPAEKPAFRDETERPFDLGPCRQGRNGSTPPIEFATHGPFPLPNSPHHTTARNHLNNAPGTLPSTTGAGVSRQ